jgi:tetratricopeptide (TPR) repeat protein
MRLVFLAIASVALALAAPSLAARADALSDCTKSSNSNDKIIEGCTAVINDSASPDRAKILALIALGRVQSSGNPLLARIDFDQALKSYSKAYFPTSEARLTSPKPTSFKANGSSLTNFEWAEAFNVRGDLESNALNFNAAIPYYMEAARINPWNDSYESSLGICYSKRSAYAGAIQHLNQAVALNASSAYNHLQRAIVYKESGDQSNANRDFREAVRLYGANIDQVLGNAKATGQLARGLEIYYTRRGSASLGAGDTDNANSDFNKALEIRSDYEPALNELGQTFIVTGRYDLAVQNLSKAINLNPKDALAFGYRGQAYMDSAQERRQRKASLNEQKVDLTHAQDDLKRALFLDPSLTDAHANFNKVNAYLAQVNAEIAQSPSNRKGDTPSSPPPSVSKQPGSPAPVPIRQTALERRLAFSVGNNHYPNFKTTANSAGDMLHSPLYDAQVMATELKALHFQVTERENLTHDDYIKEFNKFATQIRPGDTVLIYFSGHGAAIRGINLFLPTNTPLLDPNDDDSANRLLSFGIAQDDLVKTAHAQGAKLVMVISDACRNDPFPLAPMTAAKPTVVKRDWAMKPVPVSGALMIYAAGQGQTALDGPSPTENSLFTKFLIRQLRVQGQDVAGGFYNAKEFVANEAKLTQDPPKKTPHQQFPAIYDETLGGKIYLNGAPASKAAEANNSQVAMKSIPIAPRANIVLAPQ